MKLEQKRNFESLLGDTFGFIGETGRHFFPTMLRVNFLYLLGVALFAYFAFSAGYGRFEFLPAVRWTVDWSDLGSMAPGMGWHPGFAWWESLGIGACLLLLIVGAAVFAAYTPAYMILYRREGREPAFREIVSFIRAKAGRLVIYFLGMVLLAIPVVAMCVPLFLLLIFSIVGIALIPLLLLAIVMMSYLILYAYLDDGRPGFFEAIDVAWRALRRPLWQNLVCNGMVYIITAFLAILPGLFTSVFGEFAAPGEVFLGVMFVLIALVLHFAISAFYSVNIGMIYFSSKARDTYDYLSD